MQLVSITSVEEKKSFTWRLHNPEARKYNLFPREKQLPALNAGKQLDPEPAAAMTTAQSPEKSEKSDKSSLRMRIKEHNLNRRRKVSVPELGPMTTVQEVPMDSPTIPGRPALHERSNSSPVNNTWRQHHLADAMNCTKDEPDENSEETWYTRPMYSLKAHASPLRQQISPRDLAPLTIPNQEGALPGLARKLSLGRLRSGNKQQEPAARSARTEDSPRSRTPFTPYTPQSAATASTLPTPVSALAESRESPRPWEKVSSSPHARSQSSLGTTPRAEVEPRTASAMSHRRGVSDSGSVMERGRPRKRTDGTPVGGGHRREESKRSTSAGRLAFESLPQGWKSSEAVKNLDQTEVAYLQQQALGQALRFEVLKKDDVESLSKELRHLDERTDYLRRTYTSLRAGRRNLHTRICQYLRSPRVAKFSYESMLKQEEALAELDASIDDWVTKLEHAENRRTRVRQKLLEHVAAAATLSSFTNVLGVSETLEQAMGVRVAPSPQDISTPPRSPTKNAGSFHRQPPSPSPSPSPHRVVARVPSAISEQPAEGTEASGPSQSRKSADAESAIQRMESIRIYADSEVYALLADVESEFTKLNGEVTSPELSPRRSTEGEHRELHRSRSHNILNGDATTILKCLNKTPPMSPPAPSPPMKDSPTQSFPIHRDDDLFLTAAVFQPQPTSVGA
ncbi:Uu.00g100560.m01.CDS01 [Anthostomella pinea]|uniref:Uu.00g100560.m01.CDS01 n=1 Tax=Anthostomella pinea TaxID=933095 RepID=A0AAI8VE09_9PEZI|nr:Uu.00g100560.m01.CDS01 [Anthostomella pinea]